MGAFATPISQMLHLPRHTFLLVVVDTRSKRTSMKVREMLSLKTKRKN